MKKMFLSNSKNLKKIKKINNQKKSEKNKHFERFAQQTQRPPTWKTAEIELWLSAAGITCV